MKFSEVNCSGMQWLKSLSLYWLSTVMGMTDSLIGVTLVHMENLFQTDEQTMSSIFTIFAVGFLTGALLCAALYDRLNPEFLFILSNLIYCLATITSVYMPTFALYALFTVVCGICLGFNDTASQSYGIKLWSGNKFKNTLMQGFHVTWSFGGVLGPFITKSFLCEIKVDDFNETSYIGNSSFTSGSPFSSNFLSACKDGRDLNSVKYAFVTIAFIMFSANIPFITAFIFEAVKQKQFLIKRQSETVSTSEEQQIIPKNKFQQNVRLKIILLTFFFFLGLLNYYTEGITSSFLTAFALKYLQWSVDQSASLLSIFYGAQISCRILGALVSMFLRPRTMLALSITTTAIAFLSLLAIDQFEDIVWGSIFFAGFGTAIIFPTNILWMSESLSMTGKESAVLLSGSSLGLITGPLIVGQLISAYNQMVLVYFLICSSLLHLTVFIFEALFIKIYQN